MGSLRGIHHDSHCGGQDDKFFHSHMFCFVLLRRIRRWLIPTTWTAPSGGAPIFSLCAAQDTHPKRGIPCKHSVKAREDQIFRPASWGNLAAL